MENKIAFFELTYDMLVNVNGGETNANSAKPLTHDSSWGADVGYIVGRILAAFGKGASMMYG